MNPKIDLEKKIVSIDIKEAKDISEKIKEEESDSIIDMLNSIISQDPFFGYPFYIFAHKRTILYDERVALWLANPSRYTSLEQVPHTRLIWQPRLTKPEAQENSMLFKVNPKKAEEVKILWILPEKEKFNAFKKGNLFENTVIGESIESFLNDKEKMEEPEKDDLDQFQMREIYRAIHEKSLQCWFL